MQLVHHGQCSRGVVYRSSLGQLQLQSARRQSGLLQAARHHFGQLGVAELHRRQVDRHRPQGQLQVQPALRIVHGGVQHPLANRHDHAAALRDGDELRRRHHAQFGMLPAQQRFGPDDLARGE